jgi:hypothetical protein
MVGENVFTLFSRTVMKEQNLATSTDVTRHIPCSESVLVSLPVSMKITFKNTFRVTWPGNCSTPFGRAVRGDTFITPGLLKRFKTRVI